MTTRRLDQRTLFVLLVVLLLLLPLPAAAPPAGDGGGGAAVGTTAGAGAVRAVSLYTSGSPTFLASFFSHL
jgi:hypothetical protein